MLVHKGAASEKQSSEENSNSFLVMRLRDHKCRRVGVLWEPKESQTVRKIYISPISNVVGAQ